MVEQTQATDDQDGAIVWIVIQGNTKDVHEDVVGIFGDRDDAVETARDVIPNDSRVDVESVFGPDDVRTGTVFFNVPRFENHEWYVELDEKPFHAGDAFDLSDE